MAKKKEPKVVKLTRIIIERTEWDNGRDNISVSGIENLENTDIIGILRIAELSILSRIGLMNKK